jgi:hypothetical protein
MANTPREFQQCRRAPSFAVPPSICFSPENEWSPLNTEGCTELRRPGPKDDQSLGRNGMLNRHRPFATGLASFQSTS